MASFKFLKNKSTAQKRLSEQSFWSGELQRYIKWYEGQLPEMYGVKPPAAGQKIKAPSRKDSAILTWLELHQKPKYLADLQLKPGSFKGLSVLDVGAGPLPSGLAFRDAELYCLDPLYASYLAAGFPLHYYKNTHFVNARAEDMPLDDHSMDAVISVNAIDHVDDFHQTAQEIKRVLKPGGKLAMHVHYHQATVNEPIELNDKVMRHEYGWCEGFERLHASQQKTGWKASDGELYTLWRNF